MKQIHYALLLLLLPIFNIKAQPCHTGNIRLTSQSQIDSFYLHYPGCDTITGDVEIEDLANTITNLIGLGNLVRVNGIFSIKDCNRLKSVSGMNALTLVDEALLIMDNDSLVTIRDFDNLDSIGGSIHISGNPKLENLHGLEKIEILRRENTIFNNGLLANLDGLNHVKIIYGDLSIINNYMLENLAGLESLEVIYGDLSIRGNQNLTSFSGLSALKEIKNSFDFQNNITLSHCNGFLSLTTIANNLGIYNNPRLIDLAGFDQLETLGSLSLQGNGKLASLYGLEAIRNITNSIYISESKSLKNVDELSNVTGLRQYIFITKNDSITNLDGLHQICDTYLDFVTIVGNKSLSDCAAQCICEHLTGGGQYTINGNKTGCATREEIINQCLVPGVQPEYDPRFTLCPNPVHDQLQIHTSQNEDLTIFDVLGQPVRELNFTDTDKPVDVSTLPVGLYFIQLRESGMTIRFVKR